MAKSSSYGGSGDHKNFLESDGSLFKKSLLLDEDTLRKVGYEGPSLVPPESMVDEEDDLGHILTPSQAQDARQCKFIIPEPGKCFKTKDKKSSQKVFINICHSDKVPEPPIYFSENQLRSLLQVGGEEELDDVRIPMSIGAKRIDKDKNGVECQAFDIIINTNFYKEKILTSNLYWTFLCILSIEALDDKYNMELDKNNYVVMKHKACHGKPQPQFVRDKAKIREIASTGTSTPSQPTGKGHKPLIQEINPKATPTKSVPRKIDCESRAPLSKPEVQVGEELVREVSTKVYKKPEDPVVGLPTLKMTLYRNKGSEDAGTAIVELPGMKRKDYADIVINCKRDTLEVISVVGKCRIKAPLNIVSSCPEFNFDTNVLKIDLKLIPMDEEMLKDWKDRGHDLPEYTPK